MSKIAVFGSINMDLVVSVDSFPKPGETVKAVNFSQSPGGKGANQAVSAARLGGDVSMFGLLGEDKYGKQLRQSLNKQNVNTEKVKLRSTSSGLAMISVDKEGENKIIIVPGANGLVDKDYVKEVVDTISESEILLLQLETSLNSNIELLERLPEDSKPKVILDPAPAVPFTKLPLRLVDLLTPNEKELEVLTGDLGIAEGIPKLLNSGLGAILLKKGDQGAEYMDSERRFSIPAFDVSPIDTTGAGDAFNGALAVALAEDKNLEEAIEFANAAGAHAVLKKGAQSSLPTQSDIEEITNL